MASRTPKPTTSNSIQAYFPPTPTSSPTKPSPPKPPQTSATPAPPGDGFTPSERVLPAPALCQPWSPPDGVEYADVAIGDLVPGPAAVTFMGRVCNLFDVGTSAKGERAARGCVKVVVRDEGGCVTVSL